MSHASPLSLCITELADALGIADGCPEHTCDNTEPPRHAVRIEGGFMCAYVCTDCGTAWARDYNRKDD